jgi:Mor family transcriptional regulator
VYKAEEIEKRVKPEDFPEHFRPLVRGMGIEAALTLTKTSGGIMQYIPKYDCVTSAARNRLIKEEYRDGNYKQLALKYGLSEIWVRDILDKERRQQAREFMERNQLTLNFDGF